MVKRFRDLTEKYRSFRLQSDPLYSSRYIQTLFNKFTKKGKKALARRHIIRALTQLRYSFRRPKMHVTLLRILRILRLQFILVAKRQGRNILEVPFPIQRNKRDVMNLQMFYSVVHKRRERALHERLEQELLELTLHQKQSTTLRQRNSYMQRVHTERVNMEKR